MIELQQKLNQITNKYGVNIVDQPLRCESLLRDYCSEPRQDYREGYNRKIKALIAVLRTQVATELLHSQKPYELKQKFIMRLQRIAVTKEDASWAVETWAKALNVDLNRPALSTTTLGRGSVGRSGYHSSNHSNPLSTLAKIILAIAILNHSHYLTLAWDYVESNGGIVKTFEHLIERLENKPAPVPLPEPYPFKPEFPLKHKTDPFRPKQIPLTPTPPLMPYIPPAPAPVPPPGRIESPFGPPMPPTTPVRGRFWRYTYRRYTESSS